MSEFRDMSMINLYSTLGYEKKTSRRKFEELDAAAQSFYREYTAHGNVISTSRVDTDGARLCALSFLEEDNRGEKFWPHNSEGVLTWTFESDRDIIVEVLTYIFRRKNYSDYVSKRQKIREAGTDAGGYSNGKAKRIRKRSRKLSDDDDEGINNLQNDVAFIPSSLEPTTIKPWNDPPEEPSATFCAAYIQDLKPQRDPAPVAEFHRKWLSTKGAKWPTSADNRLLRFMFDKNLFMDYDHGDDVPTELLRILREGSDIEEMNPSEVVKFWNIVKDRIAELTSLLTKRPYFILAYRRDGVVRMTERFERMWRKKDIYWEDESAPSSETRPRPVKKRRKSKAVRAKTPIVFPHMREQGDRNVYERDDMMSQTKLASMAEIALEISGGQEEEQETGAEPSFFAGAVTVQSEPGPETIHDVLSHLQTPTRSVSPGDSIVVESRQTDQGGSPNTTLLLSPSRENCVLEKQGYRSLTMESTLDQTDMPERSPVLNSSLPIPGGLTSQSQVMMAETDQIADITANEESPAKMSQVAIDDLFNSMHGLPHSRKPQPCTAQSINSTTSATSPVLENLDPMWSTYQQPGPVNSDDATDVCLPKWYGQFDCIRSQNPMTAVSAASEQEEYDSLYWAQGAMNPISQGTSHQGCTSNRPGSSRSSPVEIDDESDDPPSPETLSPKDTFIAAKTPSLETSKQSMESLNKAVEVEGQPRPSITLLPGKRSNLHSLLCSTTDNFTATPQSMSVTELQAPLSFEPQSTHVQHDELPAPHLTHTGNSPRPQQSPVRGTPGWRTYTEVSDQPQTPTSAEHELNSYSPESPEHLPDEPLYLPDSGEKSKREVNPSIPRPLGDVQRRRPSGQVHHEPNNKIVLVEEIHTGPQCQPNGVASSKSKSPTSDHEGKNSPQVSSPPSLKMPPKNIGSISLTPQRETQQSPHTPTYQPGSHIRAESSPQFSETGQPYESYSSTASEFPNSHNTAPSTTDHDGLMDVDDFIKDIDDFTIIERSSDLQKETSLEPALFPSNPSHLPCQSPQPQSPIPTRAISQDQDTPSQLHQDPTLPAATTTTPIVLSSTPQNKIPVPENRSVMQSQEPITPPAEDSTPHRRDSSYVFIPPAIPFSPYKSDTARPPNSNVPPVTLSTDRRLACSKSSASSATPTLTLLIESADGNMSLETTYSFEIVENSSLTQFFQFYASISGTPLSSLTSLTFEPAFGNSQNLVVRRYGGEIAWQRLKAVMPTLLKRAVRMDKEGQMEWQVLVSGE